MEDAIIWGAGKAALQRYEWAAFAGYRVVSFVDNDVKKWGTTIREIPVNSPQVLKENRNVLLIPDQYRIEIEEQLNHISFQGRKLGFEQLKKEVSLGKNTGVDFPDVRIGTDITVMLDAYFTGFNWGGIESWSCTIADQLWKSGTKTQVICGLNHKFDMCTVNCLHFSHENEVEIVRDMVVQIAGALPCLFITHGSIAFYAALIVKSHFPDQIKLVAVAHGDVIKTYEKFQFWSDQLDYIICISRKIYAKYLHRYGISANKLLYRPNPIAIPAQINREKTDNGTLRVGFAARLRKEQKRAHFLPELIQESLKKAGNVEFDIAGEGECLDLIQAYVLGAHLESQVHIWGWIPPDQMTEFWQKEDIYLNISDYEGMSLAMLEAMVCGAVPVVTDVSGVRDLIEDGKNGFIVPVDNWKQTVDVIDFLSKNRKLLYQASDHNIKLIKNRCDISEYAQWLLSLFHVKQGET